MVKPPRLTRALKVRRNIEIGMDCKPPPNYVSSFYGSFMIVFDALRCNVSEESGQIQGMK